MTAIGPASAQSPAEFFKDKTVTFYVGLSAGGGYDVNARLVARHIGKYIPGNPQVIVRNMPGGGGLVMTNYVANVANKDGLHIGNVDIFGASPEDRWGWLGITIGEPSFRSRGYGTDVVRTMLGFAFGEMNLLLVRLQVWSYNERAIACYRKCGFVEEARLREDLVMGGARYANVVMSVTRDEFVSEEAAA